MFGLKGLTKFNALLVFWFNPVKIPLNIFRSWQNTVIHDVRLLCSLTQSRYNIMIIIYDINSFKRLMILLTFLSCIYEICTLWFHRHKKIWQWCKGLCCSSKWTIHSRMINGRKRAVPVDIPFSTVWRYSKCKAIM